MIWLGVLLLVIYLQAIVMASLEYRHPAKAVAWLLVLFIFPIVGFIMYYFISRRFSHRRHLPVRGTSHLEAAAYEGITGTEEPASGAAGNLEGNIKDKDGCYLEHGGTANRKPAAAGDQQLDRLLRSVPGPGMTCHNEVTVLTNAEEAYKAILEAIGMAEDHIHLDYYTIRNDGIGRRFKEALIAKARQGIEVRVIYDGIGSYELDEAYLGELRAAGVETKCFLPALIAFLDKRINYRNHRKIVVVDGKVGFLGGINIGDEYLGGNPKLGFWRDTHLRISGEAVLSLQGTFLKDWEYVSGIRIKDERYFPPQSSESGQRVQIVSGGPDAEEDSILAVTFAAIGGAKERIYIATPYFIPNAGIIQALKVAALSGVDVRIILPGIPDTRIVYWASLSYAKELLGAGVKFYQYQKGFMHAKVILVDDRLASVGTANMDLRSFYKNFELNAIIFDRSTVHRLERDFLQDLKDSKELRPEHYARRFGLHSFKEILARLLSPLF